MKQVWAVDHLLFRVSNLLTKWNSHSFAIFNGFSKFYSGGDPNERRTEDKLTKATRDCSRASIELIHGLMAQVAKDKLFNSIGAKK